MMVTEARRRWLEENKEQLKKYQKQYRENNKERRAELNKEWCKANPEKKKAYTRKYKTKNKDILNAKNKEYYHRTIEHQKERSKLYGKNNPEKSRERSNRWVRNNPEKAMFGRAKTRAKRKGIEFDITLEDIIIPFRCPVLNILLAPANGKMHDNSPSLDRIDSSKGYIKGNVIVISWRANRIKNLGTADEHLKIALFMKSHQKGCFTYNEDLTSGYLDLIEE